MDVIERIKQQIENNPVLIYMKGTPQFPQCGFSAQTTQALQACGTEFSYVNVLADPEIRQNLPRFSNWPTFPQVFVNGELVGGCDITMELYQRGELQKLVSEGAGAANEE
jgi:monothiol glutaredoxin